MTKRKKMVLYGALLVVGILVFVLEIFVFQKPDGILGLAICIASILTVLGSLGKLCKMSPKFENSFFGGAGSSLLAALGGKYGYSD